MIRIKTNLKSKDTYENLGQIQIELTEMNYNKIVEYALPIAMEEIYKSINTKREAVSDSLFMSILKLFYQEKNVSMDAIKAAVAVFPTSTKEELIKIILRNPQLQEKACDFIIPYGFNFGPIEIVNEATSEEQL